MSSSEGMEILSTGKQCLGFNEGMAILSTGNNDWLGFNEGQEILSTEETLFEF